MMMWAVNHIVTLPLGGNSQYFLINHCS